MSFVSIVYLERDLNQIGNIFGPLFSLGSAFEAVYAMLSEATKHISQHL